ncbi:MAG: hypothetical protein GY820_37085 [Gammaproteobacteria bacterium]|nr:hypothetical protein [Gammaproteobacteria bacterium]
MLFRALHGVLVIQEVIDRSDWQSGNSMTFTINGSGYRRAHSYNSNPALAPELIINRGQTTV